MPILTDEHVDHEAVGPPPHIRRVGLVALGACCLACAGCNVVPSHDIRTFLVDLAPQSAVEQDERALADAIRANSEVDGFEFADDVDWSDARVPRIVAHFLADLEAE